MATPRYGIDREELLRDYGQALARGYAAAFVGAGLSHGSGLVDWKGLLKEFADELGLDIEIESDLVTVAQYYLNAAGNDRTRLHAKLATEFGSPATPSAAHEALAGLPVHTIWTSNYDNLLEQSLQDAGRRVVLRTSGKSLSVVTASADALVLKLHGDLSDPDSLIITRDDYARYLQLHPGFRDRLKVDLTEKTFLFLGFSFTDPHLDFILEQLKQERGPDVRNHFAVIRRERSTARARRSARFAATRQRLKVADLERYGIRTLLIDNHSEIPLLLKQLKERYLRRYVFVSGAAADFAPRTEKWVDELGFQLGRSLIKDGFNIISGLGLGVGRSVISGALDDLYRASDTRIHDRLILWPFPIRRNRTRDVNGHLEVPVGGHGKAPASRGLVAACCSGAEP
jgi:hypothetical protein